MLFVAQAIPFIILCLLMTDLKSRSPLKKELKEHFLDRIFGKSNGCHSKMLYIKHSASLSSLLLIK